MRADGRRQLPDPVADRATQADSAHQARDRSAVDPAPPLAGASAEKQTPSDAAAAIMSARRDREAGPLAADEPRPDPLHLSHDRLAVEPAPPVAGASAEKQTPSDSAANSSAHRDREAGPLAADEPRPDPFHQARDRFAVETAPPVAGASAEKRTPSDAAAAISSAHRDREAGPLAADRPQPDHVPQAPDRFASEPAPPVAGASATLQISPVPAPPGTAVPTPPLAMPLDTASAPKTFGLTEAAREAEPLPLAPPPNIATPATSVPNPMDRTISITVHQDSAGRLEVHLAPEELGRVRVEMVAAGDRMQIHLAVERPESLDLLRRHGDQLLQEFRQSGIAGGSLSFGTWGQGEQQRQPAAPSPQNTPLPPDSLPSLAQQLRAQPAGPGLNLRL